LLNLAFKNLSLIPSLFVTINNYVVCQKCYFLLRFWFTSCTYISILKPICLNSCYIFYSKNNKLIIKIIFFEIPFLIWQISMTVDGAHTEKWKTTGTFTMLSSSKVFIGGSKEPYSLPGTSTKNNFAGCLRKVKISLTNSAFVPFRWYFLVYRLNTKQKVYICPYFNWLKMAIILSQPLDLLHSNAALWSR